MRILVVDDEIVIRQGIIKLLDSVHPKMTYIDEAKNGEEAIQYIERYNPDIVLTDIHMPVMNGLKLIETVRKSHPQIEWIILTGFAEFEYVQQALRHQVLDYLLKPVTKEKLEEVISKLLLKDPGKWTSQMDLDSIRKMKETIGELIKSVISENKDEAIRVLKEWFTYCKACRFSLLEIKQMMGYLHLFFRSELYLNLKVSSVKEISVIQQSSTSIEQLSERWNEYILELIGQISDRRAPRNKRIVDEVLLMIEREYGDADLNLAVLADSNKVTSAYLSKIFRGVMNKPITQYISEYRLDKVKQLLIEKDQVKISVIAEECGFNDYPYFSRIFKKYFGISPLEYKEKNG